MKTTIIINCDNSETKTFDQLLNENFDNPMLARCKDDDDISLIVLPSLSFETANTIIYTDVYQTFEACDYANWGDEVFFVKEISELKLDITA